MQATLKKMTLEEKVGQMIVSSFYSNFLSTDSEPYDELAQAVREYHVGGFHVFGATEAAEVFGRALEGQGTGDMAELTDERILADVDATLAHLAVTGVRLIDATPRRGLHGWRIAFVHPEAGAADHRDPRDHG